MVKKSSFPVSFHIPLRSVLAVWDEFFQIHKELFTVGSHTVVAQSCLTLRPRGLQHTRSACPSPSPEVCPNSLHRISDAVQPSHLLTPSSALNLSQH